MKSLTPEHVSMLKEICEHAKHYNKPPAFMMYASDWLGSRSVRAMCPSQRGGYIDLMCCCWDSPELALEDNPNKLRRSAGMDPTEWQAGGSDVRECFSDHPFKPGFITQRRLIEVRFRQLERQRMAKAASNKAHGKLPDDMPSDPSDDMPSDVSGDPSGEGSFSGSQVLSSQSPKSQNPKRESPQPTADGRALAEQAFRIVSENFPGLPNLSDKAARVTAWAKDVDRFLRRSGKAADEVRSFLAWAGKDVEQGQARPGRRPWTGWRSQFQSVAILDKTAAWAAFAQRPAEQSAEPSAAQRAAWQAERERIARQTDCAAELRFGQRKADECGRRAECDGCPQRENPGAERPRSGPERRTGLTPAGGLKHVGDVVEKQVERLAGGS